MPKEHTLDDLLEVIADMGQLARRLESELSDAGAAENHADARDAIRHARDLARRILARSDALDPRG